MGLTLFMRLSYKACGETGNASFRSLTSRDSQGDLHDQIESVNMSLRKITKNRGSFPSDEALSKLFYLALIEILARNGTCRLGTGRRL